MLPTVFAAALAGYGVVVTGLLVFQRRLLYHPGSGRPALGDLTIIGVREVVLTTADGLGLLAWYLPPHAGRPVVAYFHGNGGHIGYRAERLRRFARAGYGVLMAEYRGYGGNPGRPCERGLYADGEAALDFLAGAGLDPGRIVLWGESLGSGIAVYLASGRQVAGIVLEAPFTSIPAAARHHYPFVPTTWLVRDRFDSLSRIGRVAVPILIMHGERDRIVPAAHGRALLAAATAPKEGWFAPEAGHENLGQFGALDTAIAFIDRRVRRLAEEPVAARPNFD